MNSVLKALCIIPLLPGICIGFDEATEVDQASLATSEFAGALKSELMAAMQSGGAVEAIRVCSTRADDIGMDVSQARNLNVSRVSLLNRNSDNAPNDWQSAVLADFEDRWLAGESAGTLTWHEVADTDKGPEFRYMKAIPTGPLCLSCHGTNLTPDVEKKLAELYPGDKATGYKVGDLRGAFVVTGSIE